MNTSSFKKILSYIRFFYIPFFVFLCIFFTLIHKYITKTFIEIDQYILLIGIGFGSIRLIKETLESVFKKNLALDYIAILAITVSVLTHEYLVASIIVLMLTGGQTLEEYGMSRAKKSLTALSQRIPNSVFLWEQNQIGKEVEISSVSVGQIIGIRKGEVIPLDGNLISENGILDESSLTGEAIPVDKSKGDIIRSGTVNTGDVIAIEVTAADKDSTYRKIIKLVEEAQSQKAPLIRLADKYSGIFTIITLLLCAFAYLVSHDLQRVLAVLVIATPCPLILATPIALMGGMGSAAKKRIIIKRLSSLEVLSNVKTVVFDKTGTITFGKPEVTDIQMKNSSYSIEKIYAIAAGIEKNSLHPLAQAIVAAAKKHSYTPVSVTNIHEVVGKGISGDINNSTYTLAKLPHHDGLNIQVLKHNEQIAIITLEDKIKTSSKEIIQKLSTLGLTTYMFTGDKHAVAEELVRKLGEKITIKADLSPEQKRDGIIDLKKKGSVVAMVGDGINDAPALAVADVGMVFSHHEQTAASEAADIVFLSGDFQSVLTAIFIGKHTINIAMQSILVGIGLSIGGMILASFGLIPPITGAITQELIDISVIINALRASYISNKLFR